MPTWHLARSPREGRNSKINSSRAGSLFLASFFSPVLGSLSQQVSLLAGYLGIRRSNEHCSKVVSGCWRKNARKTRVTDTRENNSGFCKPKRRVEDTSWHITRRPQKKTLRGGHFMTYYTNSKYGKCYGHTRMLDSIVPWALRTLGTNTKRGYLTVNNQPRLAFGPCLHARIEEISTLLAGSTRVSTRVTRHRGLTLSCKHFIIQISAASCGFEISRSLLVNLCR